MRNESRRQHSGVKSWHCGLGILGPFGRGLAPLFRINGFGKRTKSLSEGRQTLCHSPWPQQVTEGRIVVTVEYTQTEGAGGTQEQDSSQAGAVTERIVPDVGDAIGDRDAGQALAVMERREPDAGDVGAYRDVGQAGAARERRVPDVGDGVGDRVGSSRSAWGILNERPLALVEQDPTHTNIGGIECFHRYRCQAGAKRERPVPDPGDVGAYRDAGQTGAVERPVADVGDAGGDRRAGQAGAVVEGPAPDTGDGKAIDRVWDGHRTAWTGVSRDGDRAVIGRASAGPPQHNRKTTKGRAQPVLPAK